MKGIVNTDSSRGMKTVGLPSMMKDLTVFKCIGNLLVKNTLAKFLNEEFKVNFSFDDLS